MVGRTVNAGDAKRELRDQMCAARDALPAEEHAERSRLIARRVMRLPGYRRARSRLLFASFRSEVRTEALIGDTLKRGVRLVLPRVVGREEPLALHEVRDPEHDLAPGWCGIPEPVPERCPELSVYEVDFILVPGLAFDRAGGRLGWGGGFFDWVLNLRHDLMDTGAAIAVAFEMQILERVPMQAWDVPVNLIVTENAIIETEADR